MKTYIKIFIFLTILIYLTCSIYSSSWDPISWCLEIKKTILIIITLDLLISFFITFIVDLIFD